MSKCNRDSAGCLEAQRSTSHLLSCGLPSLYLNLFYSCEHWQIRMAQNLCAKVPQPDVPLCSPLLQASPSNFRNSEHQPRSGQPNATELAPSAGGQYVSYGNALISAKSTTFPVSNPSLEEKDNFTLL